jgi:hypothetical protein
LQTFLWTISLAFAVLALAFQGSTDINIVPDYLYLLGFSALALLLSKAIVQQKITSGDVTKVAPSDAAPAAAVPPPNRSWRDWLGDIINNDAAQPDIADIQYVVFNLVALTYFFIHLFETPGALPQIPQTLIVLTGASAGTYVGNKLIQNQTPVLIGLAPTSGLVARSPACEGPTSTPPVRALKGAWR